MPDWFSARRQARRDIHAAFSVAASYVDSTLPAPVEGLHVRWHDRFGVPVGDVSGGDYAQILETVDQIVFDVDELIAAGLSLRRSGLVTLPDYDVTFLLDMLRPNDGPLKVVWTVTR